jgi:hypothetical protein
VTEFNPDTPSSHDTPERRSGWYAGVSFIGRHPVGVAQLCAALLIMIVVLQNVEPTSIDLLFWSIAHVPKLVLILASMVAGGLTWELLRRRLRA